LNALFNNPLLNLLSFNGLGSRLRGNDSSKTRTKVKNGGKHTKKLFKLDKRKALSCVSQNAK